MSFTSLNRFGDFVVMVTGSATGIGEAAAVRFASEGASVVCVDNNVCENKKTALTCETEYGVKTLTYDADVSLDGVADAVVSDVICRFGKIDVLVCAAGIYSGDMLPNVSYEEWTRTINVNLTGVFLYNQAVSGIMMDRRSGSIINISSMAGHTSWPANAEYSASKSGVIGLTRSVAMELGAFGITANAVCPGNTITPMGRKVADIVGGRDCNVTGDEWLLMRASDTALKRNAQAWEIAGVVAFLASNDAKFITGQSIEVDGGLILR